MFSAEQEQLIETFQADQKKNLDALKVEWGDAYEEKQKMALALVVKEGGQGLYDNLVASGYADDPTMMKFLANVAKHFGQDELLGTGRRTTFTKTPGEAKRELDILMADPEWMKASVDAGHAGHEEAVRKQKELAAMAWPEPEPAQG